MTPTDSPCDTIVLVHGLWMTPLSWEHWKTHYERKGFKVLTPAYPGFEIEVQQLRENPDVIADLTVPETVDHLAGIIESQSTPPIIMGHSFGGVLTQHSWREAWVRLRWSSIRRPPKACGSARCLRSSPCSPR